MRAAIYCRVSTEDQVEGHSLDYQLEDCRKAAAAAGYSVVMEYADEGVSAKSTAKRFDFQQMVEDAKAGRWDALFCWKWERLARNREDSIVFKGLLRRQLGIKVLSAKDPGGTDNPADMLIEGVLESVAEWYSLDLRQKVSRSKVRRAELGLYNGDLPFGYVRHPDSAKGHPLPPLIDEAEAAIVRMAFEVYSAGATSLADIARAINDLGAKTRNKRRRDVYGLTGPRPWTKESVKDTLANAFYTGRVSYRGQLLPGLHDAIIDEDLWRKVEAARKQRRGAGATYTPRFRHYQLKGLARCVACGEKLWANSTKRGSYYRDPASIRGLDCLGGSVRTDALDEQMDSLMARLILPESWREKVLELYAEEGDGRRREREQMRLVERQRRVARLYADEMMTENEYARERLEIEAALSSMAEPAEGEALEAGRYLTSLGALWAEMNAAEKWEALTVMIEAVYVNLQTARIVGIRPKPSFRPLFALCAPVVCDWRPRWDSEPQDTDDLSRWAAFEVAV